MIWNRARWKQDTYQAPKPRKMHGPVGNACLTHTSVNAITGEEKVCRVCGHNACKSWRGGPCCCYTNVKLAIEKVYEDQSTLFGIHADTDSLAPPRNYWDSVSIAGELAEKERAYEPPSLDPALLKPWTTPGYLLTSILDDPEKL